MRKIVLSMFMSLDGFIEGPDGEFVPPPWSDDMQEKWSGAGMSAAGLLVYGRKNYEFNSAFWTAMEANEEAPAQEREFAALMNGLPKLVLSRTLASVGWNGRLAGPDLAAEFAELKRQGGGDIVVLGGAGAANSLIALDLVEEYRILLVPILLGDGKRLFDGGHRRRPLELVSCVTADTGAAILTYRPGAASA
jgi:dihydrofolate reductase